MLFIARSGPFIGCIASTSQNLVKNLDIITSRSFRYSGAHGGAHQQGSTSRSFVWVLPLLENVSIETKVSGIRIRLAGWPGKPTQRMQCPDSANNPRICYFCLLKPNTNKTTADSARVGPEPACCCQIKPDFVDLEGLKSATPGMPTCATYAPFGPPVEKLHGFSKSTLWNGRFFLSRVWIKSPRCKFVKAQEVTSWSLS